MALQDTDKYRGKQLLNSRTFNTSYFCYRFLLKRVMIYFEMIQFKRKKIFCLVQNSRTFTKVIWVLREPYLNQDDE